MLPDFWVALFLLVRGLHTNAFLPVRSGGDLKRVRRFKRQPSPQFDREKRDGIHHFQLPNP
jgi:hypothetical protein